MYHDFISLMYHFSSTIDAVMHALGHGMTTNILGYQCSCSPNMYTFITSVNHHNPYLVTEKVFWYKAGNRRCVTGYGMSGTYKYTNIQTFV